MLHFFALIIGLSCFQCNNAFNLDRVILSSDINPTYIEFWPIVSHAWKQIVGIRPTLALIAPLDFPIDASCGDIIHIEPLPNIPTSFQAQVIRLLLPVYFPDEVCIISDIDLMPLNKYYFVHSVADCTDDVFVVYRDGHFKNTDITEYPMCYLAAKGSTFMHVLGINSPDDINRKIIEWYSLGLGWSTDQQIIYKSLQEWKDKDTRLKKLGHTVTRRIDRADWQYNEQMLKNNFYIDVHMVRPYSKYQEQIDTILNLYLTKEQK